LSAIVDGATDLILQVDENGGRRPPQPRRTATVGHDPRGIDRSAVWRRPRL
jgi:hypothetical protein